MHIPEGHRYVSIKKEIFTLYISVKQSTFEKAREKAVFLSTFSFAIHVLLQKMETFRGRKFERENKLAERYVHHEISITDE